MAAAAARKQTRLPPEVNRCARARAPPAAHDPMPHLHRSTPRRAGAASQQAVLLWLPQAVALRRALRYRLSQQAGGRIARSLAQLLASASSPCPTQDPLRAQPAIQH